MCLFFVAFNLLHLMKNTETDKLVETEWVIRFEERVVTERIRAMNMVILTIIAQFHSDGFTRNRADIFEMI